MSITKTAKGSSGSGMSATTATSGSGSGSGSGVASATSDDGGGHHKPHTGRYIIKYLVVVIVVVALVGRTIAGSISVRNAVNATPSMDVATQSSTDVAPVTTATDVSTVTTATDVSTVRTRTATARKTFAPAAAAAAAGIPPGVMKIVREDTEAAHDLAISRPCLYDSILACLRRTNHLEDNHNQTFSERHDAIDECVREWLLSTAATTTTSSVGSSSGSSYRTFKKGRGQLKDRLDWALVRFNATAAARSNLQQHEACGTALNVEELLLPSWGQGELPSVSHQFAKGGVFLPPYYGMEPSGTDPQQRLKGGFVLPRGPLKRTRTKLDLIANGFDTNIYTSIHNLGDCYNHYLVSILSGKNVTIRDREAPPSKSGRPYVCIVGSVLHRRCDIVWGTGVIIKAKTTFVNPKAEVFATRGPDTLALTPKGHDGRRVAFGDPGLLLPLILPMPEPESVVDVCLIPHYIDHETKTMINFQKELINNTNAAAASDGFSVRILNIESCSLTGYVQKLSGCKKVLSSSLHGLIFALAYGIPGARLLLSDNVYGGHFKFLDFYKGIGYPELYVHERVIRGARIPFKKLYDLLEKSSVPALNVEDLWNANPFHAENLGMEREEHLAYVRSYTNSHQEYYPHKPYADIVIHTRAPTRAPLKNATAMARWSAPGSIGAAKTRLVDRSAIGSTGAAKARLDRSVRGSTSSAKGATKGATKTTTGQSSLWTKFFA